MEAMKGDMGGAACVVAAVMAIAQLECPVNVVGLVPLCENMPSGNAVKPGDVVTAMNGKTIVVSGVSVNTWPCSRAHSHSQVFNFAYVYLHIEELNTYLRSLSKLVN
jgi:hypothetical protein